jgi:excisionase family DNA binding protein
MNQEFPESTPALLTRARLAKRLNVSVRTLDKWIGQKRIPVMKFSPRCYRFSLPAVLAALDRYTIREAR